MIAVLFMEMENINQPKKWISTYFNLHPLISRQGMNFSPPRSHHVFPSMDWLQGNLTRNHGSSHGSILQVKGTPPNVLSIQCCYQFHQNVGGIETIPPIFGLIRNISLVCLKVGTVNPCNPQIHPNPLFLIIMFLCSPSRKMATNWWYPLVICYIAIENHHFLAGTIHYFYGHFQ